MAYDAADSELLLFGGFNGSTGAGYTDSWVYKSGWSPLNVTTHPGVSYGASMAYDYKDHYVLLFGGENPSTGYSSQTWKFAKGAWTQLTPSTHPPALYGASMVWDANDSYMVLFGGVLSSGHLSSATWSFVGGTWTSLSPSSHPSGRYVAQMGYDNANGWVLLYGGYNTSTGATGDTWNFSHGQWTLRHPAASPPALDSGALANDSSDGYLVLFGGFTSANRLLGTTWSFVNGTWAKLGPATPPSARELASMAFDRALNKLVLFGGDKGGVGTTTLGDFWSFHANVWAHVLPPAPNTRSGAAMVYDEADGYVLLFGGFTAAGILNDSWSFVHGHWTHLKTAVAPPPRYLASMAYDALDGYVVLFGGYGTSGFPLNDTWTYSAGKWTKLTPPVSPEARSEAGMAYDAADGYVLLTGGYGMIPGYSYYSELNDTWTFSGGYWTERVADCPRSSYLFGPCVARPPGTQLATVVYDAYDGYVLDAGGYNSSTNLPSDQTWAWSGGTWYDLTNSVGTPPAGRGIWGAAATYDSFDGYVLVYGGVNSTYFVQNTTWSYSGNAWTQLNPPGNPDFDYEAAMAYDAADSEVVYLPAVGLVTGTWLY